MRPENRAWHWWDAEAVDKAAAVVAVEADDGRFPWGSLGRLLKAAGAATVEPIA